MEILAKAAFGLYTLVILVGAVMAVSAKSLVRALVGLIATLLGVAGMYMLLAAPFLAFMQILIYAGAVCVLIFFAIMLTKADAAGEESERRSPRQGLFSLLILLTPAALLSWALLTRPTPGGSKPVEVSLALLGKGLMEDYVVAFELISVVLLVAMAGAVLLAYERKGLTK